MLAQNQLPFSVKSELAKKHSNPVIREPMDCHFCGKTFVSKSNKNKHIKQFHAEMELQSELLTYDVKISGNITLHAIK